MSSARPTSNEASAEGWSRVRASQSAADSTVPDALDTYLDVVLGDGVGYAHLATATGWQRLASGKPRPVGFTPTAFSWPAERVGMVTEIRQATATGGDVWLTPYVLTGARREKGTAVDRRLIHTDVDGPVDLAAVTALGGFAVASGGSTDGRPHAHVYVALAEPVDAVTHTRLCRALCQRLAGDRGKVSDNDLLRPPGTVNGKPTVTGGHAMAVSWLVAP
jgi:hypothetical protein